MKMSAAVVSVCVIVVLFVTRETAGISPELQAADAWEGPLPCGSWNCECASRQQSRCCAAAQMDQLEEQMFTRLLNIFSALSELKTHIEQITGIFMAPCADVFSFSLVYSNKGSEGQRLYQRVALVRQGRSEVAMWEDNREDAEDTECPVQTLRAGEQVYTQLMSGREICGDIWGRNIFSGYLLYPTES